MGADVEWIRYLSLALWHSGTLALWLIIQNFHCGLKFEATSEKRLKMPPRETHSMRGSRPRRLFKPNGDLCPAFCRAACRLSVPLKFCFKYGTLSPLPKFKGRHFSPHHPSTNISKYSLLHFTILVPTFSIKVSQFMRAE